MEQRFIFLVTRISSKFLKIPYIDIDHVHDVPVVK